MLISEWTVTNRVFAMRLRFFLLGTVLCLALADAASAQQIVGCVDITGNPAGGEVRAFLWQNGVVTHLPGVGCANAINNAGQVVGSSYPGVGTPPERATLWQNGVLTDLSAPGDIESRARAINNVGQVVGEYFTPSGPTGEIRVFLWQNGVRTDLGLGRAWAINDAGQVVGEDFSHGTHGFLWQNGVRTGLGTLGGLTVPYGINDSGQVVGVSQATATGEIWHAFLWQSGVITDLGTLGGRNSVATAINELGQVVGYSDTTDTGQIQHAFLWQNGVMTDLGTLGGGNSYAAAINDAGQVVGYSDLPGGTWHAFLWQNGVITDLGTLGGVNSSATGISSQDLLVDPVTDDPAMSLLHGSVVTTDLGLLATKGRPVQGVAADGVSQVVIRIPAAPGDQLTFTVMDDLQPVQSTSTDEDGALGKPGDSTFAQHQVTVAAQNTGKGSFAFAVYRAPVDFARFAGTGAYKSGSCGGTRESDNQSACRTVPIRVQNQTRGTTTTIPVRILRPPVVLIHGLWASPSSWDSFSPFGSPSGSDRRFSISHIEYVHRVGGITSSVPAYSPGELSNVLANSLGFEYNTARISVQIINRLQRFKGGSNSASLPVAATQVDVVAHSMGGDIIRTLTLQPGFLRDDWNFRRGSIHKLVTIDTPHVGSPLAIELLSSGNSCIRRLLARAKLYSLSSVTLNGAAVSGAVGDLQGDPFTGVHSPAIEKLLAAAPGQPQIPSALIGAIETQANLDSLDTSTVAALVRASCSGDPLATNLHSQTWENNFRPDTSDGIVGIRSQFANLSGSVNFNPPGTYGFAGYLHTSTLEVLGFSGPSVLDSNPVATRVIDLLNTPITHTPAFVLLN